MHIDPYWPKWHSPWWHMMLIHEMGKADEIPGQAIEAMVAGLKTYLHFFPYREEEVPPGRDPLADVACHCQLGCAYQLLQAAGVNVDKELPWARQWFVQYQLPDGGFNCDESAYTKAVPRSSVVSTLPVLECLLSFVSTDISIEETRALDAGAQYLLQRQLFRSVSKSGSTIDESWKQLAFPRFYEYDLLRGLSFVVHWSLMRRQPLPFDRIAEALNLVNGKVHKYGLSVERQIHAGTKTRVKQNDGSWSYGTEAASFSLLTATSQISTLSPYLTRCWQNLMADLTQLANSGLIDVGQLTTDFAISLPDHCPKLALVGQTTRKTNEPDQSP